jgi:cytochrome b pre-mRNA-processing protein 3
MPRRKQSPRVAARVRQWLRRIGPAAAGRARRQVAAALYRDLVNQARTPVFYRDLGVPDSPEGRFEMVGLHVALVVRRLRGAGPAGRALAQELFDLMFADIDESLRRIGIGDLSVGKQVKRLAGNFYARLKALDEAFAGEPMARLRPMLRTNVYHGGATPTERQLDALVRYLVAANETLRARPAARLLAGRLRFADPDSTEGLTQK